MSVYNAASALIDILYEIRNSPTDAGHQLVDSNKIFAPEEVYVLDSKRDTKFAQAESDVFSNTVFIFTQQWVGIRQACGAFPVSKLAIDGHHRWTAADIIEICKILDRNGIRKIVSHGMAPTTASLLAGIKCHIPEMEISSVWHGTMAGWAFESELRLFQEVVDLAEKDVIRRIGFLRRGMGAVHPAGWRSLLFNVPPLFESGRISMAFDQKPIKCLFGSWNNQWKNMYTNIVGASLSKNVDEVLSYQPVNERIVGKVSQVGHENFDEHMIRLSTVDLSLNISINDCQPMTELESIAVGTPALRPNLDQKIMNSADYDRLFTVDEYLNAESIRDRIDMLCRENPRYILEVIDSYRNNLIKASYKAYGDFLAD